LRSCEAFVRPFAERFASWSKHPTASVKTQHRANVSRVCGDLSLKVTQKAIKTTAFYFSPLGENQHRLWLYDHR
jgi:hypothetical protein